MTLQPITEYSYDAHDPSLVSGNHIIDSNITLKHATDNKRLIFKRKYTNHEDCPICMLDMFSKVVGYTPCGHVICRTCLVKQIDKASFSNYKYSCPICRMNMRPILRRVEQYNKYQDIQANLQYNT